MEYRLNDILINGTGMDYVHSKINQYLYSSENNQIITFNLDFLRISTEDNYFKSICIDSALVVPDGVGVTSLLRYKYKNKFDRITGNDLFVLLLTLSNSIDLRYAFVGGSKDVQSKLSERLILEFPNLNDKFFISPELNFEKNESINQSIIEELSLFKPDVLFVALGCPRQEKWIYENKNKINAKISIGIGAAFDFFVGNKKRAPVFLQRIGLEWGWRLFSEPKRLHERYLLNDIPFFIKSIRAQNKGN